MVYVCARSCLIVCEHLPIADDGTVAKLLWLPFSCMSPLTAQYLMYHLFFFFLLLLCSAPSRRHKTNSALCAKGKADDGCIAHANTLRFLSKCILHLIYRIIHLIRMPFSSNFSNLIFCFLHLDLYLDLYLRSEVWHIRNKVKIDQFIHCRQPSLDFYVLKRIHVRIYSACKNPRTANTATHSIHWHNSHHAGWQLLLLLSPPSLTLYTRSHRGSIAIAYVFSTFRWKKEPFAGYCQHIHI